MKAVEVEALPVDLFELIVAVDGLVDVAGGIHRHRKCLAFQIDLLDGIADHAAAIVLDTNLGRMADLNRIPRDHGEFVARDAAACVARRGVKRVRPDAVAAHVGDAAIEHLEIRRAFLQQNSAGGVVALARVEAAAVGDLYVVDPNGVAGIHQNREAGDAGRLHLSDFQIRRRLRREFHYSGMKRENMASDGGRPERPRDGIAVAVEREIVHLDVLSRRNDDQSAAAERGRRFDGGAGPRQIEIVRVGGQHDFAGDFDDAGR